MIGYIPLYDKMGDDAKIVKYLRADTDKFWAEMIRKWFPGLCAKPERDEDGGNSE